MITRLILEWNDFEFIMHCHSLISKDIARENFVPSKVINTLIVQDFIVNNVSRFLDRSKNPEITCTLTLATCFGMYHFLSTYYDDYLHNLVSSNSKWSSYQKIKDQLIPTITQMIEQKDLVFKKSNYEQ